MRRITIPRKIRIVALIISVPAISFAATLSILKHTQDEKPTKSTKSRAVQTINYESKYGNATVMVDGNKKIVSIQMTGYKDSPLSKVINESKGIDIPGLKIAPSDGDSKIEFSKEQFDINKYYDETKKFGYEEQLKKALEKFKDSTEYKQGIRLGRQLFEQGEFRYYYLRNYDEFKFSDKMKDGDGVDCRIDFCFEVSNMKYDGDPNRKLIHTDAFESDHPVFKLAESFIYIQDLEKIDTFLRSFLIFEKAKEDKGLENEYEAKELLYVLPNKGLPVNISIEEKNELNTIFHLKFDDSGKTIYARSVELVEFSPEKINNIDDWADIASQYENHKEQITTQRKAKVLARSVDSSGHLTARIMVDNTYIIDFDENKLKQYYIDYEENRKQECLARSNCTYSVNVEEMAQYRVDTDKRLLAFIANREIFLTYTKAAKGKRFAPSQKIMDDLIKKYFTIY